MIDPGNLAAFANDGAPPAGTEGMDPGGASPGPQVDKFATLRPLLEEFSGEIEGCCDEIDPDTLRNPGVALAAEDSLILKEGVAMLDPKLQEALLSTATAGISPVEAGNLGVHLEAEGIIQDADRLAGWLFRVGQEFGGGGAKPQIELLPKLDDEDVD